MRLIMALKVRGSSSYVRLFGKSFTPPRFVLGNPMELRQVENNRFYINRRRTVRQRRFARNLELRLQELERNRKLECLDFVVDLGDFGVRSTPL